MVKQRHPVRQKPAIIALLKHDYEVLGLGTRKLHAKYGIASSTISYLAKNGGWIFGGKNPSVRSNADVKVEAVAPTETAPIVEIPVAGAVSASKKRSKGKVPTPPPTADVIQFPNAKFPPAPAAPKRAEARMLPEQTKDERTQLRVALTTIRAMLPLDHVGVIERHEGVLRGYTHLLEVVLDPHAFVERGTMTQDEYLEEVVRTQLFARKMLLPTDRDTLAGAIKTLTNALEQTIRMKRQAVGMPVPSRGAALPFQPNGSAVDAGEEDDLPVDRAAMEKLSTADLRQVTAAMELLQRRQHQRAEQPKPPPPDSIDDLIGLPIDDPSQIEDYTEPEDGE